MTSPPVMAVIRCPVCFASFETYYRPSINLTIEGWTDEQIEEEAARTCPVCATIVDLGDRARGGRVIPRKLPPDLERLAGWMVRDTFRGDRPEPPLPRLAERYAAFLRAFARRMGTA